MTQTKEKTFEQTMLEYRTIWNREQFLEHINLSWNTVTKILLYNPKFQEDLKVFVHYPVNIITSGCFVLNQCVNILK